MGKYQIYANIAISLKKQIYVKLSNLGKKITVKCWASSNVLTCGENFTDLCEIDDSLPIYAFRC